VKDSKEFGWNINGDITFDWKRLVTNKVSKLISIMMSFRCLVCISCVANPNHVHLVHCS
jgi:hypothetical protein